MRGFRRWGLVALLGLGVVGPALSPDKAMAAPGFIGSVNVPATVPGGVDFPIPLDAGTQYLFVAEGQYRFDPTSNAADAECSSTGAKIERNSAFIREQFGPTTLDLLVNGTAPEWAPIDGAYTRRAPDVRPLTDAGCSRNSQYRHSLIAPGGTVNLRIDDIWHGDNQGFLRVSVFRLDHPVPLVSDDPGYPPVAVGTAPPSAAYGVGYETLLLDSSDPDGVVGSLDFIWGRKYTFYVSGNFTYDGRGNKADAECSTTHEDPILRQDRYDTATLDVILNGHMVDWQPVEGTDVARDCNEQSTYQLTVTATENSKVSYRVFDPIAYDNVGFLSITVVRHPD